MNKSQLSGKITEGVLYSHITISILSSTPTNQSTNSSLLKIHNLLILVRVWESKLLWNFQIIQSILILQFGHFRMWLMIMDSILKIRCLLIIILSLIQIFLMSILILKNRRRVLSLPEMLEKYRMFFRLLVGLLVPYWQLCLL
jgi:hypothetical protein